METHAAQDAARPDRSRGPRRPRRAGIAAVTVLTATGLALAAPSAAQAADTAPAAHAPAAAGPAASAVTASTAAASAATPEAEPAALEAGYADCPELPQGVDPARWRCEVHLATPKLRLGAADLPALRPIMMVHAEGPLADGTPGQVWGAWHGGGPVAVPGGLPGTPAGDRSPVLGLSLEAEYGGASDFYTGSMEMRFRLSGPLLPDGCEIGRSAPVSLHFQRAGSSEWVSRNPPLIHFSAYDEGFAVPAPEGCGPLTGLLSHRLGLPAASGNLLSYDASYTFRTYDRLR
ncbi:hypothetical protein AB0442_14860 [Kitasatospora sp. NPDC085895]|uniref:hypothetical protein n=1 Tax=Kitasatospora sp. NPDC085895 TaxID=3155057 RepID=UPI00344FDD60